MRDMIQPRSPEEHASSARPSEPDKPLIPAPINDLVFQIETLRRKLSALVPLDLQGFSAEQELLMQYAAARELQSRVLSEDDAPVNQLAQVLNATTAILAKVAQMQADTYTSERFKRIEGILLRCLRDLPEDTIVRFLDAYKAALSDIR